MSFDFPQCASWIELSRKAFENNVKIYKKLIKSNALLGCVLKGNAYGHGFLHVLEMVHEKIDLIFVINPLDAYGVREYEVQKSLPKKRVVVLGAISPQEALVCAQKDIEVVVDGAHWANYVQTFQKAKNKKDFKPVCAHIHMDTGLGREGFTLENLAQEIYNS